MGEAARRRRLGGNISDERYAQLASVGDSADAVSEADRRWFARRPHRSHRVRIMARCEGVQMAAVLDKDRVSTPPAGYEWVTVVRQLRPGVRMRQHMHAMVGADLDGASEEECAGAWKMARNVEADRMEAAFAACSGMGGAA